MTTAIFEDIRRASRRLARVPDAEIAAILHAVADRAEQKLGELLGFNDLDLSKMPSTDPKYDRLMLTESRIRAIASDMRKVAALPSPLGLTLEARVVDSGLELRKVTVPLGVVGVIYEARPNVTFDVFALCLRSGNACILKGGSDAWNSNQYITATIRAVLSEFGLPPEIITLLPPDRAAGDVLLNAVEWVDVIIPRGSQALIDHVRKNSRVPVIETGAGIVHTYFDVSGDLATGAAIVLNAKTRRVSVCNALDCLIVHEGRLADLPALTGGLAKHRVIIYADPRSLRALEGHYPGELLLPAGPEHFGTEFLDYKLAIRTVASLDEALEHIARFSSRHSEAVVARDEHVIDRFLAEVDAAAVYSNASTAFTDGGQFGLGAEIGISTQKLHARGPMGLRELTSYKWVVRGTGQTR